MSDDMREIRQLHALFCERYPFLSTKEGADGCCRWASLAFADMAAIAGVEVNIIRWRVWPTSWSATPEYCEHWAVDLGHGRILDPTSAQVEGLPSPWVDVLDYPHNYMNPESVAARVLLPTYRAWRTTANGGALSRAAMQQLNRTYNAHTPLPGPNPLRYVAGSLAIAAVAVAYLHFFLTH